VVVVVAVGMRYSDGVRSVPPFLWAGSRGMSAPAGPFLYPTSIFYHKSITTVNNMINYH
jgi:hypothetical protein